MTARPRAANALPGILFCLACGGAQSSNASQSYGENAEAAYQAALEDFEDEDCLSAEPAFRQVRRDYPYSRFAALSELRIADCLMQLDRHQEAISAYERFVRFRPSHPEVPYARFKVAEGYYRQIPDDFFLLPPSYELDQSETAEAMTQLRRFILDYPEDPRIAKAQTFLKATLTLLARHELYVAEYYLDRGSPDAATQRLETLLSSYQGSNLEPEALMMLGRVRLEQGKRSEARATFEDVIARFPESAFTQQARAYLRDLTSGS